MRLALNPDQERLLRIVREALPSGQDCYLVGGAVRDYLLGQPLHDLDFVLPENPLPLAIKVSRKLNAAYFILDDQRNTARVVYTIPEGKPFPLDFVHYTGENLETDLRNRDFTINAMALSVHDINVVIDPLNGQADLEQGLLRTCTPHALADDPVRILRAVRLAKQFSLNYAPGLSELAQEAARNLPNTSAERQRDELFRILEGPEAADGIADAERFGVFKEMIPNLSYDDESEAVLKKLDRSLSIMTCFKAILKVLDPSNTSPTHPESPLGLLVDVLGSFREKITEYFSEEITVGRSKTSLACFGILLLKEDHPENTSEEAWETARRYQLSNAESDWIRTLVYEYRITNSLSSKNINLDRRAIYRFFNRTGNTGVALSILYLANSLANPGELPRSEWEKQAAIVYTLLQAWWEDYRAVVDPKLLLNGHDIQNSFGILPGEWIGRVLKKLKEAQAAGEVTTLDEAMAFVAGVIRICRKEDEE